MGYAMMMADEISVIEGGTSWCVRNWNEKLKKVKMKGMIRLDMFKQFTY